jgi:hypothetical protein
MHTAAVTDLAVNLADAMGLPLTEARALVTDAVEQDGFGAAEFEELTA